MSKELINRNITWVDAFNITTTEYFLVTHMLWTLESTISNSKILSNGYGEVNAVDYKSWDVLRDSMHWSRRYEYPWIFYNIPKNTKVLDVGASRCAFQFLVSEFDSEVYGIDLKKDHIDDTNKIADHFKFNVHGVVGDGRKLPFADNFFDVAYSISTLEHIIPRGGVFEAIDEMIRVTKPGGKVIFSIDVHHPVPNPKEDDMFDSDDFIYLANRYGLSIPDVPIDALRHVVNKYPNNPIIVACVELNIAE
jgi:ubiquinone/menaquinone biosynthesis C-methylase UbiE